MKLLVCSDIHGSLPAARSIGSLASAHAPDAVLLLGDILYHGPRNPFPDDYDPAGAAEVLAPLASRIIAVKGNCDSDVDSTLLSFPLATDFTWILGGGLRIFATHGHAFNPQAPPPLEQGDMLLFGHTHIPLARTLSSGIHIGNPGSLALPKGDSPPCFALLENNIFTVLTDAGEIFLQLDCR